jgi:hypothetical protein
MNRGRGDNQQLTEDRAQPATDNQGGLPQHFNLNCSSLCSNERSLHEPAVIGERRGTKREVIGEVAFEAVAAKRAGSRDVRRRIGGPTSKSLLLPSL